MKTSSARAVRTIVSAFALVIVSAVAVAAQSEAAPGVENSPAGLRTEIEGVLGALKAPDAKADVLVESLKIPDGSTWFTTTFGEEVGQRLAAKYKDSWPAYAHSLQKTFEELRNLENPGITVKDVSETHEAGLMGPVVSAAKAPIVFYKFEAAREIGGQSISVTPGLYFYLDGAFRVLNWVTLYELPHVRPMRIRVGGNIQAASLIRQVRPIYPEYAESNRIQGTVVLHTIVARDGTILQLEYVSGPKELMRSAMDAVKEWRYKPTLLNGEPVEVDTTISVVYTLGR